MRHVLVLALAAGCASSSPADNADTDVVLCPDGPLDPYAEDAPAAYEARTATWTPAWTGAPRTVPLGLWGPTEATSGTPARYLDLFEDPGSFVGAEVTLPPEGCRMPLVVWSHGSQAWQGNATSLLRRLVRQGWVLAAPDHVGNTLADDVQPRPPSYPLTRAGDVIAAIDAVEALPDGHPLTGRVDTSRVLVVGHSFGGQTASLFAAPPFDAAAIDARCAGEPACSEAERAAFDAPVDDPRVAAVMPLAGFAGAELVSAEGWAASSRPLLLATGTADWDGTDTFARAAGADLAWLEIEGACHESFTDTPLPCEGLEKGAAHDMIAPYLVAFASVHVLGRTDADALALLDGSVVVDEAARLHLAD